MPGGRCGEDDSSRGWTSAAPGSKVLVSDEDGTELLVRQRPTPWRGRPRRHHRDGRGRPGRHPGRPAAVGAAERPPPSSRVTRTPASRRWRSPAWGRRGCSWTVTASRSRRASPGSTPEDSEQIDAMPARLRASSPAAPGCPRWPRSPSRSSFTCATNGLGLPACVGSTCPSSWPPSMGAEAVSEYSLASRTGLLDQDTGEPWSDMLDHLGVTATSCRPLVDAGTARSAAAAPTGCRPDSPVRWSRWPATTTWSPPCPAARSPADRYHVSMGTAEVLLRVVENRSPSRREPVGRAA